ncbi:unnamed protein product [Rotaria socialis]|uniref:Uncharacterized protein n=1 Tax=Rotaria socialis TaxID=392032 RepID=A0A818RYR3_9BILA|nr:unnamed protein product [Rotaria socialis]CAF3265458.1 unnamed protein product [Rotaria socialis]CAF3356460.1 unnamed protein product [Rotaria socialis]CAF3596674.1 unnamed protein product [Rotaria socialis]CAF3658737.1 unnamed protein product [Rotaria socialis]
MIPLSSFFCIIFAVASFYGVSAEIVKYTVTFDPCVQNATCPQGNPAKFNHTFALNGTLSPKLNLTVGDRLQFNLAVNVSIHPLTICQNSPIPQFCQGVNGTDELNIPITQAGETTSVTFIAVGTYYYGCNYHPGMGALINVTSSTIVKSSRSRVNTRTGHKLRIPF